MVNRCAQTMPLRNGAKKNKRGVLAVATAAAVVALGAKGAAYLSSNGGLVQRPAGVVQRSVASGSRAARSPARVALRARGGEEDDEYDPIRLGVRKEDLQQGEELQGVVTRIEPYGCFVDIDEESGKLGFVPMSKMYEKRSPENIFGEDSAATLDEKQAALEEVVKVGKGVTVWVADVNERGIRCSLFKNKAFGARQPRANSAAPVSKDVTPFQGVAASQWLEAKVDGIQSYGAFVVVTAPTGEQATGLVPISQVKAGRVEDISKELSEGQDVKVRVVEVQPEKQRLSLTLLTEDEASNKQRPAGGRPANVDLTPFQTIAASEWIAGKVDGIQTYGAFVSVTAPGGAQATGLVPITQIKDDFVNDIAEELTIGQEVKVRVTEVQADKGRMSLSMLTEEQAANRPQRKSGGGGGAPAQPKQDVSALEGVADTQWLEGKVVSIENFGAFVEVVPPSGGAAVRGLVYIKDIADEFVEDPYDFIEEDMDVKVRVVKVDKEKSQVALSMVEASPAAAAASSE
eukprot:TRINITY_DN5045_c0_g3_i1.p1 TRINITY_DN5045_c0_g3~~TRINITY_DN5045_c0_g3_i1.p1  ORF type:complete len:517 (+),score=164.24 TRINITY_DN5045_c0_g3_i1:75-1625(+)